MLPFYYEGAPDALLEALRYGLSCLVSDIPATREMGFTQDRFFPIGECSGSFSEAKGF